MTFEYGIPQQMSPLIRRLVCNNPGPLTFKGTNSYIIGQGNVAVVDPGPDDPAHLKALMAATKHETVTHILVTHSHNDHSPNADRLKALTGAKTAAFWPRTTPNGTAMKRGMHGIGDTFVDHSFRPDIALQDNSQLTGQDWTITSLHTPGHAPDHLCFALLEENALFSGDHVMGWSSTAIAPPEGNMAAYMHSLETLLARSDKTYYPAHGSKIDSPHHRVTALIAHRQKREASITDCLENGDNTIDDITAKLYSDLDSRLLQAAKLSVFAQLEYLVAKDKAATSGKISLTSHFTPKG